MGSDLTRRLGAEFVGTALLVFVGAGAFVGAVTLSNGKLTYAAIGFIALAFALIVAGVIYAFGRLSGGHFNPAVTLALTLCRRFPLAELTPYVLVQIAGGILGALLIIGTFGHGGRTCTPPAARPWDRTSTTPRACSPRVWAPISSC